MNKHLTSVLKFLLFLGIGLGLLYLVFRSQDANLSEVLNGFRSVNYAWIALVLVVYMISNISRALRWNMLLKPLAEKPPRFINALSAIMIGYLVNSAIPRAGEVAKPGVVSKYEELPLDKVLGTIVVDRALDVLCLLLVFLLALLFEFDKIWGYLSEKAFQGEGEQTSLLQNIWVQIILGIMLLTGIILLWQRKRIMKLSLYKKIKEKILGFWEGILSIRKLERPGLFIFHTITIWFMYFLMTYLCFFAYEPVSHLGPVVALSIFIFGSLGMVIPSPGGVGSYQYLVTQGLILYGIAEKSAFIFSNIVFWPIFACNILLGFLAFILLPIINRKTPTHVESVQ